MGLPEGEVNGRSTAGLHGRLGSGRRSRAGVEFALLPSGCLAGDAFAAPDRG